MEIANADTRLILMAMGIFDTGDTCECCLQHSLYIDTYIHDHKIRKYCPVCAQVYAINGLDITPTMSIIENIVPLPSYVSAVAM